MAMLFPLGCMASAAYGGQTMAIMIMLIAGLMLSFAVMADFGRAASSGLFVMAERSLEISRRAAGAGGYRSGAGTTQTTVVLDGREMGEALHDVKVLSETPPGRNAKTVYRVYLVFERTIVTLEVTRSLLVAIRLAGLVRRALRSQPSERVGSETPTGGGCLVTGVMVIAEIGVVAAGIGALVTTTDRELGAGGVDTVGVIATGTVIAMFAVQRLLALPMRRAMREHVLQNLGIERR